MILAQMGWLLASYGRNCPIAATAPMKTSPERMSEKTPRETPTSLASGLRKTRKVLDLEKAEAMWATKPTATIVRP